MFLTCDRFSLEMMVMWPNTPDWMKDWDTLFWAGRGNLWFWEPVGEATYWGKHSEEPLPF